MTNFSLEAEPRFNLSLVGNRDPSHWLRWKWAIQALRKKADNAISFCFMFQAHFASNNIVLLDHWVPV